MTLKNMMLLAGFWLCGSASAQQAANYAPLHAIEVRISPWQTRQALIYVPENAVPGKKYPLLVCFHGRSIAGKDLGKIFREGVTRQMREGRKIEAVNPKDKKRYEFIVLAPLALSWTFTPQDVDPMLDDVIKRFPVDTTRIYLTGYSAGGWATESAKTHSKHLASRIAACVTMSPPIIDSPYLKRYKLTTDANIHTWYFAGLEDGYVLKNIHIYADSTNKYKPGLVRMTVYPGGHCCWHEFYNPRYRENGMNVYEWLLQYRK
jgi:predicted peptidase